MIISLKTAQKLEDRARNGYDSDVTDSYICFEEIAPKGRCGYILYCRNENYEGQDGTWLEIVRESDSPYYEADDPIVESKFFPGSDGIAEWIVEQAKIYHEYIRDWAKDVADDPDYYNFH